MMKTRMNPTTSTSPSSLLSQANIVTQNATTVSSFPSLSRSLFTHVHAPNSSSDSDPDTANSTSDQSSSAIILRNQDTALSVMPDSAAGQFLQERSWKGLETRLGEDAPSVLEQGRSGIARGYGDDHRT